MNISIEGVVFFILYILGAGVIFGLLIFLIGYVEANIPTMQPFAKFARIALMVLGILVLISIVLSVMGHPIIRLH